MSFIDKIMDKVKEILQIKITPQLTQQGNIFIGGQHYHIDKETAKELLMKPDFRHEIVNSTMNELKSKEDYLKSLSEKDLDQVLTLSTWASTASVISIDGYQQEPKQTIDSGETFSPSTTVAGTHSTDPQFEDDDGETI